MIKLWVLRLEYKFYGMLAAVKKGTHNKTTVIALFFREEIKKNPKTRLFSRTHHQGTMHKNR